MTNYITIPTKLIKCSDENNNECNYGKTTYYYGDITTNEFVMKELDNNFSCTNTTFNVDKSLNNSACYVNSNSIKDILNRISTNLFPYYSKKVSFWLTISLLITIIISFIIILIILHKKGLITEMINCNKKTIILKIFKWIILFLIFVLVYAEFDGKKYMIGTMSSLALLSEFSFV